MKGLRSGFRVRLCNGVAQVHVTPRGIRSWKAPKLRAISDFAHDLAERYRDLDHSFTLFGREKAPEAGDHPDWFVCARWPHQRYRLWPDYIAMRKGKLGLFVRKGQLCAKARAWTERETRAVWRGSNNTMPVRRHLVALSRECSDMLDARIVATGRTSVLQGLPRHFLGHRMATEHFARYRYQVNTDSWGGLVWKLLSGSVVIEMMDKEVPWMTWRHLKLKAYEHYVPATMDTLLEQIEWCRENDLECQRIAAAGRRLCLNELGYKGALRFAKEALS